MEESAISTEPPAPSAVPPNARSLRLWSLAWFWVVGACVLVALSTGPGLGLAAGLSIGLLPALATAIFARAERAWPALLGGWTAGALVAVMLSGGATGPLSSWCLAPLAAAGIMGRSRLMPLAAALSLAAGGCAALWSIDPPILPPTGALSAWLGGVAVLSIAASLGAGLILAWQGRAVRAEGKTAEANLLDASPHLVLSLTPSGLVTAAHGEWPMGMTPETARELGLLACAARPEDRAALEQALEEAYRHSRSRAAFAPAGAPERWCSAHFRWQGDGRLAAVIRDATEEHWREADLRQGRAEAEARSLGKSRFIANMSHELRTPLNAIMGFSDIMRARLFGPMGDKYGEYAELIHESGGHLLDLVNDILDLSKIEADRYELSREVFDAREAIAAVVRLTRVQAEKAGVELKGLAPPYPIEVDADQRAIKQMALNLVANALKFTPAGGQVTITARALGEVLEIVVADTGVGIKPEDIARLGRPYEQAGDADQRASGTGLGLSLVRALAGLHGGELILESEGVGKGARATIRIPAVIAAAPAAHAQAAE